MPRRKSSTRRRRRSRRKSRRHTSHRRRSRRRSFYQVVNVKSKKILSAAKKLSKASGVNEEWLKTQPDLLTLVNNKGYLMNFIATLAKIRFKAAKSIRLQKKINKPIDWERVKKRYGYF